MSIKRVRQQFFYSKRPGTCRIEGKIPLLAGGAVGTVSIPGVTSVVKAGTGLYTINLNERYVGLAGFDVHYQGKLTWDGTGTIATDGYGINLVSDAFVDGGEGSHAMVNAYDGYCQLQVIQPDGGGSQDLPLGSAIWFALDLKTSQIG